MLAGQPIIILRENVERTRGFEAQRSNIMAAKAIAAAVRTTLGPRGMDKMLISSTGDVVITNDGATILHEMSVQHPGGKLVVEVAEAQDSEVGDGTTTAIVLLGSLMDETEKLLTRKIHPTIIAHGYQLGMEKALSIVDEQAIAVDYDDRETLVKVAGTAMTGKAVEAIKDKISGIVVDAVRQVATRTNSGTYVVDEGDIKIKKQVGETMHDAELIRGVVIEKKRAFEQMPTEVKDAKVALLAQPLEITKTQVKSKIKITTSEQMKAFSEQERESLRKLAETIVAAGANVVLCQKGIADAVQYYLAKHGVYAVEDVKEEDMKFAARALCGTIVNKPEELNEITLGRAEATRELPDTELTVISGCENPKAVTILLRGTSQLLVDELERAVYDGARVIQDAIEDGKVVAGGGSVETELQMRIRDYAATVGGRVQLAIEAFANAFEVIPRTLAENSGFDPIDMVVALRKAHADGEKYAGIDVYTGEVVDMYESGVIEPERVKIQAIKSATETATLLTRVDDMMVTQPRKNPMDAE
ncbi:MAG TPA: thermosome subunit alpha [Candidatus Methanoculleus thermohydrogenotrophicum]|jgi:thermosome|nr:thermosome subunit alpha [Candidatus Methanoculleus thermohydrogenotrophicum]NLM81105.1 thermosome subunit [Candidatus Methanoculleus thermohydrogenotrophicum]HOB17151.1 thermosome subunit alpha [Candidatus Methanoculleus thermohydrogenotrophicum]HPZ37230.1 thermosome subunit alpha [Candidatus Methanoculleus thermohydrogenotrophicum]HQC90556.1 thermosome subunit alpha [Candidatus Methanoculleus thermohydrogenotrophicum]